MHHFEYRILEQVFLSEGRLTVQGLLFKTLILIFSSFFFNKYIKLLSLVFWYSAVKSKLLKSG